MVRERWFSKLITREGCMVDVAEVHIDAAAVFESSTTFQSGLDGGSPIHKSPPHRTSQCDGGRPQRCKS